MQTQIEQTYNEYVALDKHVYATIKETHARTLGIEVVKGVAVLNLTDPHNTCEFLQGGLKVVHVKSKTCVLEIPYRDIYSMFTFKVTPSLDLSLDKLVQFVNYPEDFTNFVSIGMVVRGGRNA